MATEALWLHQGRVAEFGDPDEVVNKYMRYCRIESLGWTSCDGADDESASTATSSTSSSRTRPTLPDIREYAAGALGAARPFMVRARAAPTCARRRSSTALGNFWSVLDPLFQAAIYYFLYTVLRSALDERRSSCPS